MNDQTKHDGQPVNQRLLAALKDCEARLALLVAAGRGKLLDAVAAEKARAAITAAEAAQTALVEVQITDAQIERHTLSAGDCPADSNVMLVSSILRLLARNERFLQPASAQPVAAPDDLLSADDMKSLRRFAECCEDPESGGHDVEKADMKRLELAGAVRSCGFGRHETTAFGNAMLSAAQKPDDEQNATQWWLASLDKYGNPKLEDGAHSERAGANQALYLINSLDIGGGKKFAVAKVQLFEPVEDSKGVNHEAIAVLNTVRKGGAA